MAIVNNGTKNSLESAQLPTGYVRPTVTEIPDFHYSGRLTLNVLKSTVEASTGSATMTAILANTTIGITKQVTDILALDFLGTATVTAYANLVGLTHNIAVISGDADHLKNIAVSYICTVDLYVKAL